MLFLSKWHDHHEDDHDDHGGLHRDLVETGAAMDRRSMRRLATRYGAALGALQLVACAADASTIAGTDTSGAPLADYALYLWHCDRSGNYSLYSSGYTNQNWLRGVQAADANGVVRFTSIYPGCYSGRWPHIHFEVCRSIAAAASQANEIATSQIAIRLAANALVYATSAYASSATNQSRITLATDNVFSDGASLELATVTGDVTNGMTAALTIGI